MLGRKRLNGVLGVAILVVISSAGLALAINNFVSHEIEDGLISSSVQEVSDASASGGYAIKFASSGSSALTIPSASTVGVRCAPTSTITATQALATLRATGYLSCITVAGNFTLAGSDGVDWVIEDVRFEPRGDLYGIRGYRGVGGVAEFEGTQAQRPILRHIDIMGGGVTGHATCSAAIIGKDMIFEHANITGCQDGIKADDRLEIHYSWIHDHDKPLDAHSDGVQIVSGQNIVFRGNRFDAYSTYSSDGSMPTGEWDYASGMLQTGTITGEISGIWENNWFAGGRYTIRGTDDTTFPVNYTFRDNRWLRFGSSVALGRTDMPPNQYGPIYTLGASDFDCSNVWDDTNQPIVGTC